MKDSSGVWGTAAAVRESRGIALEEIARSTKINVNYLRAIERGELKNLPGGIYNVSYIRQYARAVDFDEQELLRSCGHAPAGRSPDRPDANRSHGERSGLGAFTSWIRHLLSGVAVR
jgi:cytoskeletal protein RodZ